MEYHVVLDVIFFFKQKTAYEMRISDWSSDVCSSDLFAPRRKCPGAAGNPRVRSGWRSEERRVGKEVSVRVDLGGRRIIKKKITVALHSNQTNIKTMSIHILLHNSLTPPLYLLQ